MGGTFAVAQCEGVESIFPTWQKLVAWAENNGHRISSAQCLEECLNPELNLRNPPDYSHLRFDLYLPIVE
jgi:effector-binding domain-containing protein